MLYNVTENCWSSLVDELVRHSVTSGKQFESSCNRYARVQVLPVVIFVLACMCNVASVNHDAQENDGEQVLYHGSPPSSSGVAFVEGLHFPFSQFSVPRPHMRLLDDLDSSCSMYEQQSTDDDFAFVCPLKPNQTRGQPTVPLGDWGRGRVNVVGLAFDGSKLRQEILFQLLELNCVYQADLLISSRLHSQQLFQAFAHPRTQCYHDEFQSGHCGHITVIADPDSTTRFKKRVERIAHLRDNLKEILRSRVSSTVRGAEQNPDYESTKTDDGAVIVLDLDLYLIPSNDGILQEVHRILYDKVMPMDVICANGLMHHPFGYYDIFATVLEDGTFVYPLSGRMIQKPMKGENRSKIRSNYLFDIFNQDTLLMHFSNEANPDGLVHVRSCFGGMAIYRRSTYLERHCNYTLTPEILEKYISYSNREDECPCEHVVFHDCLRDSRWSSKTPLRVAIQTSLVTWWDTPYEVGSILTSGGIIAHGLVSQDGLVRTRSSHRNLAKSIELRNGNFRFYIDSGGTLILDDISVTPPVVKWRVDPLEFNGPGSHSWEYAFLTLNKDGSMHLTHQYPTDISNHDCFGESQGDSIPEGPCRHVVWKSQVRLPDTNSNLNAKHLEDLFPLLHLGQDGIARIVDLLSREIVWQTTDEVSADFDWEEILMFEFFRDTPCIESGTDQDISKALNGPLARAVLCKGAVFHLNHTVHLTSPGQAIYTEGFPSEKGRAILRLHDPSVTVAVSMKNCDFAQIRNVVVDGNRERLGAAIGQDHLRPLIQAGGRAHGQVVANVTAMNTRSWAVLHFIEGDIIQGCTGARIEHNVIGPAGYHELGAFADGISCACHSSLVRWNKIVDATDVGLVQFGGSGTIVEGNEIYALSRSANAAISLVDFHPYNGDFGGTVVRNNVISASNASIGIGIAMGARIWKCGTQNSKVVRNGIVTGNIVCGENIHFGFAVDGVANWTILHNIDMTDRTKLGLPVDDYIGCRHDNPMPPFGGFLINPSTSQGIFQEEFKQESDLEFLIASIIGLRDQTEECLESGNQDAINAKLSAPFARAVLCPGAVFNLSAPVIFTAPYQAIYTKGKPVHESSQALLILTDPEHPTAVHMKHDYCALSHVIVDGNRGRLGPVKANLYANNALIQAGGENIGQRIQNIVARNTRSWATLHIAEGDPGQRCRDAVVQDSTFAHAGDEEPGLLSVGMAISCRRTQAVWNRIVDATDVGISLFGAPGALVEGNHLVSRTRSLRAGITLVDYSPFDGDFRGTIVRNNSIVITSSDAAIGVGIAIGPQAWEQIDRITHRHGLALHGATVIDNVLRGDFLISGLLVSGVNNFTIANNRELPWRPWSSGLSLTSSQETKQYQTPVRVFAKFHHEFPCYRDAGKDSRSGFFYVKIPKTGSTTVAGVARRIVHHHQSRHHVTVDCAIRAGHGSPRTKFNYISRDRGKSFLWSFIRSPADRALSSFFYHEISKKGLIGENTDELFVKWSSRALGVDEDALANYQVEFLRLKELNEIGDVVSHILENYDFIGLTERMDESLVVLMMLLDLDMSDILYVSSKRTGFALTSVAPKNLTCVKVHPKNVTKAMTTFFDSNEWKVANQGDIRLYEAVNRSLDLTIDSLGRDEFSKKLHLYRYSLRHAQEVCESKAIFPCGNSGSINLVTNCYYRDEGCAFECLDRVGKHLDDNWIPGSQNKSPYRLVWLLSFPNSGTSYTLELVSSLSLLKVATNYGTEAKGDLVSVVSENDMGPFWLPCNKTVYPTKEGFLLTKYYKSYRPEQGFVLTKTHCGGRCFRCSPDHTTISQNEFFEECLRYTKHVDNGIPEFHYNASLVSKIVHIYRNPLDNIVARYNHERKHFQDQINLYPKNADGFRAFCDQHVDVWGRDENFQPPIDKKLWDVLKVVPCHLDFLRYIFWHNHAHEVESKLDLPVLVIRYEDYEVSWNATTDDLFAFLDLPLVAPENVALFSDGRTYGDFFSDLEKSALAFVLPKLASEKTWEHLSPYLEYITTIPTAPSPLEYVDLNEVFKNATLHNYVASTQMNIARFLLPLAESLQFAGLQDLSIKSLSTMWLGIDLKERTAVITNTSFFQTSATFDLLNHDMIRRQNCIRLIELILQIVHHAEFPGKQNFKNELRKVQFSDQCTLERVVEYLKSAESISVTGSSSLLSKQSKSLLNEDDIPPTTPCAYDDLYEQFSKSRATPKGDNASCWSLQEEILRIPIQSLRDVETMPLLGFGTEGVVHRATVIFSDRKSSTCHVSVKTDKCYHEGRLVSCLHPKGRLIEFSRRDIVELEYIGALVFHARRKAGMEDLGILPTWGVITDMPYQEDERPPQMKALVMPIVDFVTLEQALAKTNIDGNLASIAMTAVDLVELVLPVLDALIFIENLGLSFQDIVPKNIGIMKTSPTTTQAFVADFTHLRFVEGDTCKYSGTICDFCFEYLFYKNSRFPDFTSSMYRNKDCQNFLRIFDLFLSEKDKETLEHYLAPVYYSFENCTLNNVKSALDLLLSERLTRLPFLIDGQKYDMYRDVEQLREAHDLAEDVGTRFQSNLKAGLSDLLRSRGKQIKFCTDLEAQNMQVIQDLVLEWTTMPSNHLAGTGHFGNHSIYVETNETVTVVLNTCSNQTPPSHFTVVQSLQNCWKEDGCKFEVLGKANFLKVPNNCQKLVEEVAVASCPCHLEQPALWFDKPLRKWRMLFHQIRHRSINGTSVISANAHEYSGGYAETVGNSVAGPWTYNYFEPAYGHEIRLNDDDGSREARYIVLLERQRPQVILSANGGLDGGFIINDVCAYDASPLIQNDSQAPVVCGKRKVQVSRSTNTRRERRSGTIMITYHAETENKTYPSGLGPRGKARAENFITLFNGTVHPAPTTIIAAWIEEHGKQRGQRLRDTVTPLARHLGINVTIGPTLIDDPEWTPEPDKAMAALAMEALKHGPVMIAYWSFVQGLCAELGTKCQNFIDPGHYHVLHVVDGKVISVENNRYDQFGESCEWDELSETRQSWYRTLGYNEDNWSNDDYDKDFESTMRIPWIRLTKDQKLAAASLGFTRKTWNMNCTLYQLLVPEELVYCQREDDSPPSLLPSYSDYMAGLVGVSDLPCNSSLQESNSTSAEVVTSKLIQCLNWSNIERFTYGPDVSNELNGLYVNRRVIPPIPRAIVYATSTEDIVEAIQCARRSGAIPVTARGRGLSVMALGVHNPGGVVINLEALQELTFLDDDAREIWVGPGMRMGGLYAKLHEKGRFVAGGFEAGPSIGGFLVGGGRGPLVVESGLLIDHLVQVEVVDAIGRVLIVNSSHHEDLFWSLRGAGHNQFGIVTRIHLRTLKDNNITRFQIQFDLKDFLQLWNVMKDFERLGSNFFALILELENDGNIWCGLKGHTSRKFPSVEALLRFLTIDHLQPIRSDMQFTSVLESIAVLSGLGNRPDLVANEKDYDEHKQYLQGRFWDNISGMTSSISNETFVRFLQALVDTPVPGLPGEVQWSLNLDAFGGSQSAVGAVAWNATAFFHRDSLFYCAFQTRWFNASLTSDVRAWYKYMYSHLNETRSDGYYVNHPVDPNLVDGGTDIMSILHGYYRDNLVRLSYVKTLYDPWGVFDHSHSIPKMKFQHCC